jgi:hypothetical protein
VPWPVRFHGPRKTELSRFGRRTVDHVYVKLRAIAEIVGQTGLHFGVIATVSLRSSAGLLRSASAIFVRTRPGQRTDTVTSGFRCWSVQYRLSDRATTACFVTA